MSVNGEHPVRPRSSARTRLAVGVLVIGVTGILGWQWIALAYSAATYPVTGAGEAANVAINGPFAFVTLGARGFEVVDIESGKVLEIVPPSAGSESVDDLAVAGRFLFA